MGAIKDAIDLTVELANRVQDRETAAKILQIQTLILSVQKEDAAMVSKNLELKRKYSNLKKANLI